MCESEQKFCRLSSTVPLQRVVSWKVQVWGSHNLSIVCSGLHSITQKWVSATLSIPTANRINGHLEFFEEAIFVSWIRREMEVHHLLVFNVVVPFLGPVTTKGQMKPTFRLIWTVSHSSRPGRTGKAYYSIQYSERPDLDKKSLK